MLTLGFGLKVTRKVAERKMTLGEEIVKGRRLSRGLMSASL